MRLTIMSCSIALLAISIQSASAWRTGELVEALKEAEALEMFGDRPGIIDEESEPKIYTLIKYTVVPSKAEAFIKKIKEAKKGAKAFDGCHAYDIIKTVSDNLTFYVWNVWESDEDRKTYWRSEAATKLLDFIAKEDISTVLSAARPIY